MHGPTSVFNKITHEKEHGVIRLREALAQLLQSDNIVYHGFAGHLLPKQLSHVLRVCLVASHDYRVARATAAGGIDARAAEREIKKADESRAQWTLYLFGLGPWDERLYDIILPMDDTDVEPAADLIVQHVSASAIESSPASKQAMVDFLLGAKAQLALGDKGLDVDATAEDGVVTLTINKFVMRLEHFKQEIIAAVADIPGVAKVETKLGPHFRPPSIAYAKMEVETPPKILLVDDEKDFVLTLSERLLTRNLEAAVAHDGEEALATVENDAPDVMVLDLKMPGIDGLEVLKRMREAKPHTEVIILTGHGSEREKQRAEELGAYAYLHKPVDIDVLAETMKAAFEKAKAGA